MKDKESTLLDILHNTGHDPDDIIMYEAIKQEIQFSLGLLNKRDREIVILFLGLGQYSPMSVEEISKRFNITKEHVRRLKEKALNKLRNCSNAPVLRSLFG
jgi:RNA polymerase primary sigma factor